jgi:hypothetical protein
VQFRLFTADGIISLGASPAWPFLTQAWISSDSTAC